MISKWVCHFSKIFKWEAINLFIDIKSTWTRVRKYTFRVKRQILLQYVKVKNMSRQRNQIKYVDMNA